MKKIILFGATAAIAVSILLSACSSSKDYKMKKISEQTYFLETEIEYPVFKKQPELNGIIYAAVFEEYSKFSFTAKEEWKSLNDIRMKTFDSNPPSPTSPLSYKVSCSNVISGKQYISVLMERSIYEGGAHDRVDLKSFTYDRKNGRLASITDISGLSLEEISGYCRKNLIERIDYTVTDAETIQFKTNWITSGTTPVPENFSVFTYDGETLTIYFEPYKVASFSEGIQTVTIKK